MSGPPPEWLAKARRAAGGIRATTRGARRARHSIYVVLLEDRRRAERWGLYVGQSSNDPDVRFDQHKTGYKASRYVNRFGVRLLPELFEHLNPLAAWEALEIEAGLAEEFRRHGFPWVEGGH